MIDIHHVSLTDLLPSSLLRDPQMVALARAIDPELHSITEDIPRLILMDNLGSLDEQWVDELIWEEHVEGAELATTLDEKRELVLNSTDIHETKGTRYALERIIEILGMRAIVSEWWEHAGQPFTFRIEVLEVTNKGLTGEKLQLLDRLIIEHKNTRSTLTEIRVYLSSRSEMRYAANTRGGESITVFPWRPEAISSRGQIGVGQTMQTTEIITVYP